MVAVLSISSVKPEDLRIDVLPAVTRRAFLTLSKLPLFLASRWYLAGGTALTLQVGHRQSVDLDFFTPLGKIREIKIERELLATHHWQTTYQETGTIYGRFMDAKVSFIAYPFFIPSNRRLRCGKISILLPEDIAVMKIVAISQRGRKRDFFDLYWYCQHREPLDKIVWRAIKQYPGQEENLNHVLKSLSYFADAENDPAPRIFFKASWREVKNFFKKEAPRIARKLLNLN